MAAKKSSPRKSAPKKRASVAKKATAKPRAKKKVTVAKGKKITRAKERVLEKKPGGSNTGEYKKVKASDFAGKAGASSPYSYPINTLNRARAALAYAHNAPNPEGIKKAVYAKYPELKKRAMARKPKKK